jgi:hypothetical protein
MSKPPVSPRPYLIELEGVPGMAPAEQQAVVDFVCDELDALYGGPWPVAFALHASVEGTAFAGLPWDKAWQVIELRVLDTFDLPETAVLACDLNEAVLKAEGARHLRP